MTYIPKSESSFKCQEVDAGRTILLASFDEYDIVNNSDAPEVDLVTRVLMLSKKVIRDKKYTHFFEKPLTA